MTTFAHLQRLSNGNFDQDADSSRVVELQETTEKQASEIALTRTKVSDLQNKLKDSEDTVSLARQEVMKYQEQLAKLQRDFKEVRGRSLCTSKRTNSREEFLRLLYLSKLCVSIHKYSSI